MEVSFGFLTEDSWFLVSRLGLLVYGGLVLLGGLLVYGGLVLLGLLVYGGLVSSEGLLVYGGLVPSDTRSYRPYHLEVINGVQ